MPPYSAMPGRVRSAWIGRAQRDAGAVGQAVTPRAHRRAHRGKPGQLLGILRAVFIRAGQVAEAQIDIEPGQQRIGQICHGQAETIDPGIDHHMAHPAPARDPACRLRHRIEHRAHAARDGERDVGMIERPVQHRDGGSGHMLHDLGRFAPVRDKPVAASRARQHRHDLRGAQSIGVSLDRRAGVAAHPVQRLPVGGERVGIEAQAQGCRTGGCRKGARGRGQFGQHRYLISALRARHPMRA